MLKKLIVALAVIGLLFGAKSQAASTFSNGTLIKGSGPEIYVLEHGTKRWISTAKIFSSLFYSWDKVKIVSDDTLTSFPNGAKMGSAFSDGILLKSDKGLKVYLYDGGKLRWISSAAIFDSNNFSWENVFVIPDKKIKAIKVGTDVKSGEFLLLPASFFTVKPPKETNIKKVTFSYSGINSTGSVSGLTWETYMDGYDKAWQGASSKYTRTIDLPAVNKTYTFYIRSRNKDGKHESRPISYTFKIIGFSSALYNQLKISGLTRKATPALNENIKITNISKADIDITGLFIKNQKNEKVNIPQAVEILYLQSGDSKKNLILEPGKSVIVFSGASPVGKNFRLNICAGYLNYFNFPSKLPAECPKPIDQEFIDFNKTCRDYIKNLKVCTHPNTADFKPVFEKQCTDYLLNTFNYSNCVTRYRFNSDFLKNDWYIFLDRSLSLWDDSHDEAKLLDKDGSLIAAYSY